jgi:hypothetical protein
VPDALGPFKPVTAPEQVKARTLPIIPTVRQGHADALRGLIAILVVSTHLRLYLFADFHSLNETSWPAAAFYAATGIGHQAYILLFALNGFLVGGKAVQDLISRTWSWSTYLLYRNLPLISSVIPGIVFTYLFDHIGMSLTGGAGYFSSGADQYGFLLASHRAGQLSYSILTLAGNLVFMQGVCVPFFGTNDPLVNFSEVFWPSLIFALGMYALIGREGLKYKSLSLIFFFTAVALLQVRDVLLGVVWSAGAALGWLTDRDCIGRAMRHISCRILALTVFPIFIVATYKYR